MASSSPPSPETAAAVPAGLARFNALAPADATAALREVCASAAWVAAMRSRRPYATVDDLNAASDAVTAELTAEELAQAMAAHPPIGRPEPGDARAAREQRGMGDASEALRAQMLELNLAYQDRFGHVFLICATGLTGERIRDALLERLGHTADQERETVREELAGINRIRLTRLAEDVRP